jgi:hypothetical protein
LDLLSLPIEISAEFVFQVEETEYKNHHQSSQHVEKLKAHIVPLHLFLLGFSTQFFEDGVEKHYEGVDKIVNNPKLDNPININLNDEVGQDREVKEDHSLEYLLDNKPIIVVGKIGYDQWNPNQDT